MKQNELKALIRECLSEVISEGRKICAWCKKDMGYFDGQGDSHGICPECFKKMKAEIRESNLIERPILVP